MLRARLGSDSPWDVCSAGVMACYGSLASRESVRVMEETGIDTSNHMSRPLTADLVDAASLIVVMTTAHAEQVKEAFPAAAEKTLLLKAFDPDSTGVDIDDPIGMPVSDYRRTRGEIDAALPGLIEFLVSLEE